MKKRKCKYGNKIAYHSLDQAKEARKGIKYNNQRYDPLRIYQCPNCKKYHLTHSGY